MPQPLSPQANTNSISHSAPKIPRRVPPPLPPIPPMPSPLPISIASQGDPVDLHAAQEGTRQNQDAPATGQGTNQNQVAPSSEETQGQ